MITNFEMRALELNSEYFGVTRLQLMENAGQSVANEIATRFTPKKTRVVIFCGLGGNGGDGFVVARHLTYLGFKVCVILAGKSRNIRNAIAKKNWVALQALRKAVVLHEVYDSSLIPNVKAEVVVDALLGMGSKGRLRPPMLQLVRRINGMEAFRVAVDVPTGLDPDSGEPFDETIKADVTVTFHETKSCLITAKAKGHVGELCVRSIGIPREFEQFAGPGDISILDEHRPPNAHKGDYGKLLIVGGSEVFTGAPALVGLAALRTGLDLAYIAAPKVTAQTIASMSPNLITVRLEGAHLNPHNLDDIRDFVSLSTAVVIGPGLGLHSHTEDSVMRIIAFIEEEKTPLLLDADGLKAFAMHRRKISAPLVLTPHAEEYRLLSGKHPSKNLGKRAEQVQETAQKLGAVILLKGPVDVVSDGERVKLNFTGNAGMTVGGTGDVLAGIVGGFLARGVDPFRAAVAGAFINGAAGDFVQLEKGNHMVSTDIIDWIPQVMKDPMSHAKVRRNGSTGY
ncbi:MAG: NAD(P)H-hydrate dehydratase [Candidatus Bathyarchaeota archaeon]|nr:MAG: NAD(P)H-hydrate dehydratase [Candidatus Bathyarchaeota archaeon]